MLKREEVNKLWEMWQKKPYFKEFCRLLKEYDLFQSWTDSSFNKKQFFSYDYYVHKIIHYKPQEYFSPMFAYTLLPFPKQANVNLVQMLWGMFLFDNATEDKEKSLLSRTIYNFHKHFNTWRGLEPTYPNWKDKLVEIDKYIALAIKEEEEKNKIWEDLFTWEVDTSYTKAKPREYEPVIVDYEDNIRVDTSAITEETLRTVQEATRCLNRVYATTIASDLVAARPMEEPIGSLHYMDYNLTASNIKH